MENKINIAQLLKDCPQGMELDCVLYDDVTLECVSNDNYNCYPIKIHTPEYNILLNKYGCLTPSTHAKCVIFPKGKTSWEGFVPPREFKDGDILVHTQNQRFIMSIYHKKTTELTIKTHCILWDKDEGLSVGKEIRCYVDYVRLATEEEKQKLFKAIKEHGYKWNEETKTLEKLAVPKFKVGDKVRLKNDKTIIKTINYIYDDSYALCEGHLLFFKDQDNYELVPNKFDINSLIPFESRVLVRDYSDDIWRASFWGCLVSGEYVFIYDTTRGCYRQCIPYEGNEHLLGKTDNCDNFYKIWENI